MGSAALVTWLILLAPSQTPAPTGEGPPGRCRSVGLLFDGAEIDRLVDREAIRAHLADRGELLVTADEAAGAELTLTVSAAWGRVRTSEAGYHQTCLAGAASYRLAGADASVTLAESCPLSGTEMTPEFARSGALDQWTASARGQFTRKILGAVNEVLASLGNGVTIASQPPGARVLRDARLEDGPDGTPQGVGGVALESVTPAIVGCLPAGAEVAGVLTLDGHRPRAFRLRATPQAAQPPLVLTAQPPAGQEAAGPVAPAPDIGLPAWLPWAVAAAVALALFLVIVARRRRRPSAGTSGDAVGSYTLIEPLGQGGMGEVWRAEHAVLGRPAAVKLVRTEPVDPSPEGRARAQQRFEQEARATAALRSPHTIELYDYGAAADGSYYYVMELLDGMELETLVERFGPQSAARTVHLLAQACAALDEAHGAGLIHRDIKPANIFASCLGTSYDFVKVLDFGIVKSSAQRATKLTGANAMVGTPAFLAPETLASNGEIDGRVDIYGLGCVAYWLLTGALVFEGEINKLLYDHVNTAPVPPSARTEIEVPADLEAVILSCLAKSPADRPRRAADLAAALEACACAREWTAERAAAWWRKHAPTVFA